MLAVAILLRRRQGQEPPAMVNTICAERRKAVGGEAWLARPSQAQPVVQRLQRERGRRWRRTRKWRIDGDHDGLRRGGVLSFGSRWQRAGWQVQIQ